MTSPRLLRRGLVAGAVTGILVVVGSLSEPDFVSAEDRPVCSNHTLRGDYGFLASGERRLGPTLEKFTASGVWTFDGGGAFTFGAGDGLHGALTGSQPTAEGLTGTYTINPNCTGTLAFQPPLPVPPIQFTIVVVDNAKAVKAANTTGLSTLELTRQ